MGPHRFQRDRRINCAPFEIRLRIDIVKAANGRAALEMPFHIECVRGAGLMPGGALVVLADTAAIMVIRSVLPPLV